MRRLLTIAVLLACALQVRQAIAHPTMVVGKYTGDGVAGRTILGLGFQPDAVLVKGDGNYSSILKTTTMPGGEAKQLGGSSAVVSDGILSLDSDGFTVGSGLEANATGVVYYWAAFMEEPGEMAVGSYLGDGTDDRWLNGLGLSPAYLIVTGQAGRPAMHRFDHQLLDKSLEFKNTGEKNDRIQDFGPDGFQVGRNTTVNDAGSQYNYIAWTQSAGVVIDSSYTGDGISGRVLLGFGFEPDYVLVQGLANSPAVMRTSALSGDSSLPADFGAAFADGIRSFQSDGIELGAHKDVNLLGGQYSFIAFKGIDQADIQITKSASAAVVAPGETLEFDITAGNLGPGTVTGVSVEDLLPAGLDFVASSASHGSYSDVTGAWSVGALAEGESADLRITTVLNESFAGVAVSNTARLAGVDQPDPAPDNDSATVIVDVNTVPVLESIGPQIVDEGQVLDFGIHATDADGDSLFLTSYNPPVNSALIDSGMGIGSFHFMPDYAQAGDYTVVIVASDGAHSDSEAVTVTVNDVNRAPILVPIADKVMGVGEKLKLDVYASDPDGETPTLAALDIPANATFKDNKDSTGTFEFEPGLSELGAHIVLFIASDGSLADTVSVTITVVETNRPPILSPVGPHSVIEGGHLRFDVTATDPEGTFPTLAAESLPTNATFVDQHDGSGNFTLNPTYTQSGTYDVLFVASDGVLSDSEWVVITITEAGNQPPVLNVAGGSVVTLGSTLHLDLTANDPDNANITITMFDAPANSDLIDFGDGTGSFDFTPDAAQVGSHPIGFVASDGALADTVIRTVTVVLGTLARIEVTPDSAVVSADDVLQFTVAGYDADGNPADPGSLVWGLTEPLGSINSAGLFEPTTTGSGQVFAKSGLGPTDTSQYLGVIPGTVVRLHIDPDTALPTVGETRQFTAVGLDAEGNATSPGIVVWSVLGAIGSIDQSGYFTAEQIGTGRVIATRTVDAIADTTGLITVLQGDLARLIVTPDTASLQVGQAVSFAASGYTSTYEPADPGTISWSVLGNIGTVDVQGRFTAESKGTGRIVATSSVDNVSDTSSTIVVDVLMAEELPLGNATAHAGQARLPALAFTLENRFGAPKGVTGIRVHDESRGAGTPDQVRSNVAGLSLYTDANGNEVLDPADPLLGTSAPVAIPVFNFPTVSINPVSRRAFFVAHDVVASPRDSDSLDFELEPATGVVASDGSTVGGATTINSLGVNILDGLTVAQVTVLATGNASISPEDGMTNVMVLDVPRNGYSSDVLEVISIINHGTAVPADFDSVVCYADAGNGAWDGFTEEIRLGRMQFTGGLWSISGLAHSVTAENCRLFVAAQVSAFASNGATLSLGMPLHGIEMSSNNDGPIDGGVTAVETISILANQGVVASVLSIPAMNLIPGEDSEPIAGIALVNGLSTGLTMTALDCRLILADPRGATLEQLTSQIDSVSLWLDRDNEIHGNGPPDSLIATAVPSGTAVRFEMEALTVAGNGAQLRLACCLHLNRENSRDGNLVNLAVDSEFDFEFAQSVSVSGSFPLKNPWAHTVDAFPLASTTLHSTGGNSRYGGQSQVPILDFELPRAGYSTDALMSLRVINRGSVDASAVSAMVLWADADGDGFDLQDQRIGTLTRLAGEWRLSGVSVPLNQRANRFITTVDIPVGLSAGGTLDLEIPIDGVLCASGMDGPDDQPIRNDQPDLVFPSDRITVIATPRSARLVNPGSMNNRLLLFALYNGYRTQAQTLTALSFVNESRSSGGADAADVALGTASLYRSADSFGESGSDELVATGQFAEGRLRLPGMSQVFQPEQLAYFHVSVDLPLDVADGDSLAIGVGALSDFEFSGFVDINGDLPSGVSAPLIVDGSVAVQYDVLDVGTAALASGQDDAAVFAFKPARNGDLTDVLAELNLVNEGTAGPDDLAGLTLWRDTDGDAALSGGDVPISGMSHAAGIWTSGAINVPVNAITPGLLVTADIAGDASPDASVRFGIPQNGCEYASGNDGPLDEALSAPRWLYISGGSLAASLTLDRTAFTVGQPITATIEITNWLSDTIDDIVIRDLGVLSSGSIRLDSVSGGSTILPPGASSTIRRFYTAVGVGSSALRYRAVTESLHDSSGLVESPEILVQSAPAPIPMTITSSIPAAVTRGQSNVFPLTIVLQNNSDQQAAPVCIERLTISANDFDRQPLSMAAVAKRLVLTDDRRNSIIAEEIPDASGIEFRFAEPVLLRPAGTVRFSLLLDVADSARFGQFRLALSNADAVVIRDANTGQRVPFTDGVTFPLSTSACRILNPAGNLAVSATSIVGLTANRGQADVGILRIRLSNVGDESSAQIMLTRLSCQFVGIDGSPLAPGHLFSQVRLLRAGFALATVAHPGTTPGMLPIELSAPLILSPGETEFVELHASVDPPVTAPGFRLVIPDSTAFVCRDLSSGLPRLAVSEELAAADSAVFPIQSAYTQFRDPAAALNVCLESALPPNVISGSRGLVMARVRATYPAHPSASPVVLSAVKFLALDTLGRVLDPLSLFDRVGYRIAGGPIEYLSAFGLSQGAVELVIPDDELRLEPGDEAVVELIGDLEADAPYDHFRVSINDPGSFAGHDGTDTSSPLILSAGDQCELAWPFSTSATSIILPAGRPALHLVNGPTNLAPLGAEVKALEGRIDYGYGESQGTLLLDRLAMHLTRREAFVGVAFPFGDVFDSITLLVDGEPVATATSWQSDLVTLEISPPIPIAHGDMVELTVTGIVSTQAPLGSYAVNLVDSTSVAMRDAELGTGAYVVVPDGSFPLRGAELSVAAPDLAASFTTFPNPFNPLLEETATVGYVLPVDAQVDITIYSITGSIVRKLVERQQQAAGSHSSEHWDGRNENGDLVVPGTYFCQLHAVLATSATQTHRRKVVVLR